MINSIIIAAKKAHHKAKTLVLITELGDLSNAEQLIHASLVHVDTVIDMEINARVAVAAVSMKL